MNKVLLCMGLISMMSYNSFSQDSQAVRPPAVAGQFYPADPATLASDIKTYISEEKPVAGRVRILIGPHAGYVYSGPVAGHGFAVVPKDIKTVIILGLSHHVWFEGCALPDAGYFATPLGNAVLNKEIIASLLKNPLFTINNEAHRAEHSVEVQIPFIQTILPKATIVPIVTGKVDPVLVAKALLPFVTSTTLVIASSDLSHYHTQAEARVLDDRTIATIVSQDASGYIDACGETPIRIAMALAKKMKMVPTLLDARTSYETAPQSGPATRVVGYASIVYVEDKEGSTFLDKKEKNNLETKSLSDGTKKYLLTLARQALELATNDKTMSEPDVAVVPQEARDKAGCFVTLTMKGQLRGCIGYIQGIKPLYLAVMDNARNAALNDPRFSPVTSGDAAQIVVEISVLTEPEPIVYKDPQDLLQQIVPGQDGIILQKENHQSTFLPQVWEQLTNKVSFLEHLSIKGGMSADAWKSAYVKRYRAIHFSEK